FRSNKNHPLHTSDAAVLAVVRALTAVWPASLDFNTLLESVRQELPGAEDDAAARKKLLDALHTLFRLNSLRYTLEPAPYDTADAVAQDAPALIPGFAYIRERRADLEF